MKTIPVYEWRFDKEEGLQENPVVPFKENPPSITGKIYSSIIEIRACKSGIPHKCDDRCKESGHRFKHTFKQKACIYALSDGSLLIK